MLTPDMVGGIASRTHRSVTWVATMAAPMSRMNCRPSVWPGFHQRDAISGQ